MIDHNKPKFAVLFVDDEEKARKMFKRLVSPQFNVFTACDVNEAMEVLKKEADQIGVLITDQRMPGLLGVDLLRHVRKEYPTIIRLLTTAYSDLSDAIEAVNTGEIFRYINKPWNVDELLIDLQLAMNFFMLQKDRNQLIHEKLSVLQHQTMTNTLKNLISIAGGQTSYHRPLNAVNSFLQQLAEPISLLPDQTLLNSSDYWTQEIQQSQKMLEISRSLNKFLNDESCLALDNDNSMVNTDWNASLDKVDQNNIKNISLELDSEINQIHFSQAGLNRIMSALTDTFTSNNISICISNYPSESPTGIINSFSISATPDSTDSTLVEHFLTATSEEANTKIANLLGIFILSYSVGGSVQLGFEESKLGKIEIKLPMELVDSLTDISDNLWMEDLFVQYS